MALRKRIKTTPNRGTQLVNVPIRIHNLASELIWEVVHAKGEILFEGSARPGEVMTKHHLGDDSMKIVRRFLAIDPKDEKSILRFLVDFGEFRSPVTARRTSPPEHSKVVLEVIPQRGFEKAQDYVRRMLITGNATLPALWRPEQPVFKIFFVEAERGSEAYIWVDGVYPSMLATIQFKLLQGAIFRTCARKDCRLPFEVTSRHTRRFCSQYCAHITSLRQRRRSERKAKRKANDGK